MKVSVRKHKATIIMVGGAKEVRLLDQGEEVEHYDVDMEQYRDPEATEEPEDSHITVQIAKNLTQDNDLTKRVKVNQFDLGQEFEIELKYLVN